MKKLQRAIFLVVLALLLGQVHVVRAEEPDYDPNDPAFERRAALPVGVGVQREDTIIPSLTTNGVLTNGDFETGTFESWTVVDSGFGSWFINDGVFDPEGDEPPTPPFGGNFSAVTSQEGAGEHVLFQDVTVPGGQSLLTYVDKWSNYANAFENDIQEYRVEIRDTNDSVLQTLFETNSESLLFSDWTVRQFNISQFTGQTIRIAFVEIDNLFFFNVHIDDVSISSEGSCILDLNLSYNGGTFTMNMTIGTGEAAELNIYLAALNFVFPIATGIPLPANLPSTNIPLSFPLPSLGGVGGLVTMTTPDGGIVCLDWDIVDTGSPSSAIPSASELQEILSGPSVALPNN